MKSTMTLRCASLSVVIEEFRRIKTLELDDFGAVGAENDRRRPAPALIALRDIRPVVLVHVNRDKPVRDDFAHRRIVIGNRIHLVAGMTPPGLQAQEDELILFGRAFEYLVSPGLPREIGFHRRGLRTDDITPGKREQ
jgi:hypothetical protein